MKLRFSYGPPITPAITSRQRQPNVRERSGDDKHIHRANNRIVKFKASAAAALDANLDLGAAAVAPRDIIGYWIVDNARLRRVHDLGIREHCSTYPLHQEPSVQFNFRPSPRRRGVVLGGHFDTTPIHSGTPTFMCCISRWQTTETLPRKRNNTWRKIATYTNFSLKLRRQIKYQRYFFL